MCLLPYSVSYFPVRFVRNDVACNKKKKKSKLAVFIPSVTARSQTHSSETSMPLQFGFAQYDVTECDVSLYLTRFIAIRMQWSITPTQRLFCVIHRLHSGPRRVIGRVVLGCLYHQQREWLNSADVWHIIMGHNNRDLHHLCSGYLACEQVQGK